MAASVSLHPLIDEGIEQGSASFSGGTLSCGCDKAPIIVEIGAPIAHNHACGCTKCWKPVGAVFSVVAVIPRDKVEERR